MYAIVGATGHTGRIAAERLLAEGREVRAFVRSEAKGAALGERGAELAVVDLEDDASLAAGLEGVKGVYLLLPPDAGAEDFLGSRRVITRRFVAAAKAAGVEHVVLLSSIGAQHAEGTGVIRTLHDAEAQLRASGIGFTFVRAAYFLENWGGMLPAAQGDGVLPQMLGDAGRAIPMVATADIGRVAAESLLAGPRGVIELEGPARLSPKDVAAAVAARIGRPVTTVDVPFAAQEAQLQSFGLGADVARLYREMNEGIDAGRVDFEGGDALHLRGEVGLDAVLGALLG